MVGSVRTGMSRSRQAVTTFWRSDARRRGDGDDHLVGLGVVEDPRQVVGRAVHAVAGHEHALLARVVVDEADHGARELGVAAQLERHLLAAVAGADDQHLGVGALDERPAQRALDRRAHEEARARHERQREQEVERDHATRRVGGGRREQEEQRRSARSSTTTTALTIDSKSAWSTKRHSFE